MIRMRPIPSVAGRSHSLPRAERARQRRKTVTLHIGWRDGWTFYPATKGGQVVHEDHQLQEPDGHNITLLWAGFMAALDAKRQPISGIETAHKASVLPLLGMISWRLGRSIEWDGAKEQIVGNADAAKLMSRPYRKPWEYPMV